MEIDHPEAVAGLIAALGDDADAYRAYLAGDGAAHLAACVAEAHADEIFGVPLFVFRGERFWGHDRLPLLEERLRDASLAR